MYGIVNKSIEELVLENFGADKWQAIKKRGDIDIDYFISDEPYDDAITYKLAGAISEETGLSLSMVLFVFGEWWILKTTREKYQGLMQLGGTELKQFLINLPHFHNHIMLLYPKLTPPEFKVSEVKENSMLIHYYSKRPGLKDFVHGLLTGLGKLFDTPLTATLVSDREQGNDHEIFQVNW